MKKMEKIIVAGVTRRYEGGHEARAKKVMDDIRAIRPDTDVTKEDILSCIEAGEEIVDMSSASVAVWWEYCFRHDSINRMTGGNNQDCCWWEKQFAE
jgi:hypothetical protein